MTFFGDRHFDQVKRVEKSPKAKQYYPRKIPTPLSFRGHSMPEETPGTGSSPGKAPLFVPQTRGSLDYARDDGAFLTLFLPTALLSCTLV